METAFIIMQIGNSQLDVVCKDAIVPALAESDLDPKRVDKHNEGRLLKSEIVRYIETSQIVVADLTNERPNCYLEVGYTMGLNKFQNLILTAREDHNPDSPNYKKTGPKIHFDLSGYDILFWDPNRLPDFKEELKKRVKRRQEIIASSQPSDSVWNDKWILKHQERAFEGLKKYGHRGFMEIRMTVPNGNLQKSQPEILQIAKKAPIDTWGWPIGVVIDNKDEKPKALKDGIFSMLIYRDSFDYWIIKKNGDVYILSGLFEDKEDTSENTVFFNVRAMRITEAFIYCDRLYSLFGLSNDSTIKIGIRHGGLSGRIIRSYGNRIGIRMEYKSVEDMVYTEIETTLEEIRTDIVKLVYKFTEPLFIVFDCFEAGVDDIVTKFVKGEVS